MAILWFIAALLIAGLLVFLAAQRTRHALPKLELPPGEELPHTPLQRCARRTLALVAGATLAAAGLVAWAGPSTWWDSDPVRLTFTLLLIGGLVAYLVFTLMVKRLEDREDASFDERDRMILDRSSAGVGSVMLVIVAAWMIALTEYFHESGLLPTLYLYLMFWSCVMGNVLATLAGILLAYRRA